MPPLLLVLIGIFIIGAAIGVYALAAPRRAHDLTQPSKVETPNLRFEPERATPVPESEWSSRAGSEFAGLSETARCELVFAVAALDDEPARRLLLAALDDPSEAVGLAAAHALASAGQIAEVQTYVSMHPGARADRVMETLTLLEQ